jgi:hypoxanthine phosphoribosyltransferase
MKKIYISYAEFGEKLQKLYKKILADGVPDKIIGIASGGLNLSRPLSNWLKCHHIEIDIYFYNQNKLNHGKPYFYDIPPMPKFWTNLLVVDDILDSGSTIKFFMENTGLVHGVNFKIATLHWNPKGQSGIVPDYYISKKPKNSWICYPWETEAIDYF